MSQSKNQQKKTETKNVWTRYLWIFISVIGIVHNLWSLYAIDDTPTEKGISVIIACLFGILLVSFIKVDRGERKKPSYTIHGDGSMSVSIESIVNSENYKETQDAVRKYFVFKNGNGMWCDLYKRQTDAYMCMLCSAFPGNMIDCEHFATNRNYKPLPESFDPCSTCKNLYRVTFPDAPERGISICLAEHVIDGNNKGVVVSDPENSSCELHDPIKAKSIEEGLV